MSPPVACIHSGVQLLGEPAQLVTPAASKAYRLSSAEPT